MAFKRFGGPAPLTEVEFTDKNAVLCSKCKKVIANKSMNITRIASNIVIDALKVTCPHCGTVNIL
jgi:RNase P subunit RPR2